MATYSGDNLQQVPPGVYVCTFSRKNMARHIVCVLDRTVGHVSICWDDVSIFIYKNSNYNKINQISPKPSGAPMGKVPLPILKELEHPARQNISTLNFTTTFAKTSSSCNSTLEKCQHSLKATFKKVKSQIRKGADPEKVAKRGYEEACEYLETRPSLSNTGP